MGQVELRMGFGRIVAVAVLLAMAAGTAVAQSGVTVSNVTAAQRNDNSKLVDIYYNLSASGACSIWLAASKDGGATWDVPIRSLLGDVGATISPGSGKYITWDAGADVPGVQASFRIRVFADDGDYLSNMAFVPGGDFPYQRYTTLTFVPSFWIDKYEVTNLRYCEFLNAADPNGDHWDSQMEITRTGIPPNIAYSVHTGRQNFPIRFVSALDAEAYSSWISALTGQVWRLPTEVEWEKAAAWNPVINKHWTYGFQSDSLSCQDANYGAVTCPRSMVQAL